MHCPLLSWLRKCHRVRLTIGAFQGCCVQLGMHRRGIHYEVKRSFFVVFLVCLFYFLFMYHVTTNTKRTRPPTKLRATEAENTATRRRRKQWRTANIGRETVSQTREPGKDMDPQTRIHRLDHSNSHARVSLPSSTRLAAQWYRTHFLDTSY